MLHQDRENRKEESKNKFFQTYQRETKAREEEWQQNHSLFKNSGRTVRAHREKTKDLKNVSE